MKMRRFWSLFVALAFLVAWLPGVAKAGVKKDWTAPAKTSTGGDNQTNVVSCQDLSKNILIAWDNGTDVFIQKMDATSGARLWSQEPSDEVYGVPVLDRGVNITNPYLVCLPNGGAFVAANATDNKVYMQLLDSSGNRQWGLDPKHKWGKVLFDSARPKVLAIAPLSSDEVMVANGSNTGTTYFFVDLSDVSKSCGGAAECSLDMVGNGTIKLVPVDEGRVFVVAGNGTDFNVFIVQGDENEKLWSNNETYSKIFAFADGNGGLVIVNGTHVIGIKPDLTNATDSPPEVCSSSAAAVAATFKDGYLYVECSDKKIYKVVADTTSSNFGTKKWDGCDLSTTYDYLTYSDGALVFANATDNDLVVAVVADGEENGTVISDNASLIDNDTLGDNVTNVYGLFPGSAYAVFHGNITHQTMVMKFSWAAKPDFQVSLTSVVGDFSTAEDKTISATFKVENKGPVDAPSDVTVAFYLANGTASKDNFTSTSVKKVLLDTLTVSKDDLKAGKDKEFTNQHITAPKDKVNKLLNEVEVSDSGSLYLWAVVNPDKAVDEDPYDDQNFDNQTVEAARIFAPDLTVSEVDVSPTSDLEPGDQITVSAKVQNLGNAPATNVKVAINLCTYSSSSSSCNCTGEGKVAELATETIASLDVSETYDLEKQVTIPAAKVEDGSYCVNVFVDPDKQIGEANDANNDDNSTSLSIEGYADLVVLDAAVVPASVRPGELVDISWVVKNQGGENAEATMVYFYLSTDENLDSSDTFLGADNYKWTLGGGSSVAGTRYDVRIPEVAAGDYYILVVVDPANIVEEGDEDNNVLAKPIQVTTGAILPTVNIMTFCNEGYAEVWVSVPDCGNYCGFPAIVAIQADINGDDVVDYSWTPSGWFYGWQEGAATFVYPMGEVAPVPLLQSWMAISCETLAGGKVTLSVTVEDQTVSDVATFPAE